MKKREWTMIGLAAVLSAVFGLATVAQSAPLPGDNEILGGLSFGLAQGSHTGNLSGDIGFNRYFGTWGEDFIPSLGLKQGVGFNFNENTRDTWLASTQLVGLVSYVPRPDARWVPYLGTGVGGAYNDDGGSGMLSPTAGVKIFLDADRGVSGNTYVGLEYEYQWLWSDLGTGRDNSFGDGAHSASLRIGYVWGSDDRPDYFNLYNECQKRLSDCNAALENCKQKFQQCLEGGKGG
jgi:hypothetical protein